MGLGTGGQVPISGDPDPLAIASAGVLSSEVLASQVVVSEGGLTRASLQSTSEDYRDQLQKLLPKGPAWPRILGATLTLLLRGLADELSRVHNRALALLEESDPRTTAELLEGWERVCGLPDECDPAEGLNLGQRRARVVQKLTSRGGQSKAYFIGIAAALGVPITIKEFRPRQYGRARLGEHYLEVGWWFIWEVGVPDLIITRRYYGESLMGGRYLDFTTSSIACILNKLKPAHTLILFVPVPVMVDYGLLAEPVGGAIDYGLITDTVGESIDHGLITEP